MIDAILRSYDENRRHFESDDELVLVEVWKIDALVNRIRELEAQVHSLEHDIMFLEARHTQDDLKTRFAQLPPAYGWRKTPNAY